MRTDTRTDQNTWVVFDLMTNRCVGWYPDEWQARNDNKGRAIDVTWSPKGRARA